MKSTQKIEVGQILLHNVKAMRKGGSMFNEWVKVEITHIESDKIKVKGIENLIDPITNINLFGIDTVAITMLSSFDYFYKIS